jgi:hypothetical protein
MKKSLIAMLIVVGLSGCASDPKHYDLDTTSNVGFDAESAYSDLTLVGKSNVVKDQLTTEFVQLQITKGANTITAANALANEFGVRFVEWDEHLNPYSYRQPRNQLVSLNTNDPQAAFLQLFDNTNLLAVYDDVKNTVTIRPFGMSNAGQGQADFVFTPMFEYAELEKETSLLKNAMVGKVYEYHYYKGFNVRETVNAWAKKAGANGIIWRLQTPSEVEFTKARFEKDGIELSAEPIENIGKLVVKQQQNMGSYLGIKVMYEKESKLVIVHSMEDDSNIRSFDVQKTTLKSNLQRLAQSYGYSIEYSANDYYIKTPYITAVNDYIKRSVQHVAQQYPLSVEVIESTKIIQIRDAN